MKKLILTTLLMGAAMVSAVKASTLADVSVEGGVSYSTLSTSGGVGIRDDAFSYSLTLSAPVKAGGTASVGIDLFDVDEGYEKDISLSYSRAISLLGQDLGTDFYFQRIDSSFGGWDEVGASLTYSHALADLTTTLWHEVGGGSGGAYGVELILSRDIDTPVDGLVLTPFVGLNLADEYTAFEAGLAASYKITEAASVFVKGGYNDNDLDSSSAYSLDNEWSVGAGVSYKF
jgi:hypothetical protein